MENNIDELTYKEISAIAEKNGYYLIPIEFYNRILETVNTLQDKLKARDKVIDNKKEDRRKAIEVLEDKRKYWEEKYKKLKDSLEESK